MTAFDPTYRPTGEKLEQARQRAEEWCNAVHGSNQFLPSYFSGYDPFVILLAQLDDFEIAKPDEAIRKAADEELARQWEEEKSDTPPMSARRGLMRHLRRWQGIYSLLSHQAKQKKSA